MSSDQAGSIYPSSAPRVGARVTILFSGVTPNGVEFRRGDCAVVLAEKLHTDGRVIVTLQTEDGRELRTTHHGAFALT